ncbi:MAG: LA2681 family HEPN domain-containing protein [Deferribacterales bacterium]
MKNIIEISLLADKAILEKNGLVINELIQGINNILPSLSGDDKFQGYYTLANLYSEYGQLNSESIYGWMDDEYPKNLVLSMNSYRECLLQNNNELIEPIVNYANALNKFCRTVEAVKYWKCDFSLVGDPAPVSFLSMGDSLGWLSQFLDDKGHELEFQLQAYQLLKELQQNINKVEHVGIVLTVKEDERINRFLAYGDKHFADLNSSIDTFAKPNYSADEEGYRKWVLNNNLFANPMNIITKEWVAANDILQFPSHTVKVSEGPYYMAAFSSIKREYCFARHLLYEGIHGFHPKYENDDLYLTDTLDYVSYDGSIEKIKASFRIIFSIFDSLYKLLYEYFGANSSSVEKVYFYPSHFRKHFSSFAKNPFVNALFWLSCDLTDNDRMKDWKAPNPNGKDFRKIRNALEHNWLRVADSKSFYSGEIDYAFKISRESLTDKTLELIRLARAALFYTAFAVRCNEMHNKKDESKIVQNPINLYRPI